MLSQFDKDVTLLADGRIKLSGPILGVPDDTLVKLRITITGPTSTVADVEQVVIAPRFEVIASRTSWEPFPSGAPVSIAAVAVPQPGSLGDGAPFPWVERKRLVDDVPPVGD
jgi:hypothetical protein